MGLFEFAQISWSEPLLFLLRIRDRAGWRNRILLAFAGAAVIFVAMIAFQSEQRTPLEAAAIAVAAGAVILLMMDYGNLQREVSIYQDKVVVSNTMGRNWFKTIKFENVASINLIRPEEWERPYGGMVMNLGSDEGYMVAVSNKVALETLANILHRLEQRVQLSDWEPSDADTRVQVKDDLQLDPEAAVGTIEIKPVEAHEPKLNSGLDMAVQLVIALWPLLLVIGGSIWMGIDIYRTRDELSWLNIGLRIGGALALFVMSFIYLMRVGQFVAAAYGVAVARRKMRVRPEAIFDTSEEDLVTVELFDRESWTKVTAMAKDFGFLKIDRSRKQLRFEGNKNRWTLPLSALKTCRIEESIVSTEANNEAERRYYVVLSADQPDGELWEYGFIYTRTEIGKDEYEMRHARAKLFMTQLADAI